MKRVLCFIIGLCCSVILFAQSIRDTTYVQTPFQMDKQQTDWHNKIIALLIKTERFVTDLNADDIINCIDYTLTFKLLWDKENNPVNCEIVRNLYSNFHHLFIQVRKTKFDTWECIEPQAAHDNVFCFYMEDYWITEYNPVYNIYGETNYWLARRK